LEKKKANLSLLQEVLRGKEKLKLFGRPALSEKKGVLRRKEVHHSLGKGGKGVAKKILPNHEEGVHLVRGRGRSRKKTTCGRGELEPREGDLLYVFQGHEK